MAILTDATYTTLFNKLNVLAKWYFNLETQQLYSSAAQRNLPAVEDEIAAQFVGYPEELSTYLTDMGAYYQALSTMRDSIARYATTVLQQFAINNRITSSTDVAVILQQLYKAMVADSKTIRLRTVELHSDNLNADGTVKKHTSNVGNGALVYTTTGANSLVLQTGITDNIIIKCTDNATKGKERFEVSGQPSSISASRFLVGSGAGPTITCSLDSLITNGNFDNWTTTVLDSWTLDSGAFTTNLAKETSTIYRGTNALKFVTGSAQLSQVVTIQPNTTYVIGVWMKKAASATGTVEFNVTASNKTTNYGTLSVTVSGLSSSDWTFKYTTFTTPASIDATCYFLIKATSVATAACYASATQFNNMEKHNGVFWGVCCGNTDFGLGDQFGFGSELPGIAMGAGLGSVTAQTVSSGSVSQFTLLGDQTAVFAPGYYVRHPTTGIYRRILSSTYNNPSTTVTLTDNEISWSGMTVRAEKEGLLQLFLVRLFGEQLKSSANAAATPSYEDPTL